MSDTLEDLNAKLWKKASHLRTYNVLLLGETGAGKSTSINALANYMKFKSFTDAKQNTFEELIPSSFSLPGTSESSEPVRIYSDIKTDNELVREIGQSSTQDPSSYILKFPDYCVRLIDTPGIGDTNGITVDQENIDKILAHLHNYEKLHGILILMKSNETRATNLFRFCLTELLSHLHKDACKNLLFCFTFSRNTFYEPGEGFAILRNFLKTHLKDVQFDPIPHENCFFIDNEAYRYLLARKQEYNVPEEHEQAYFESWTKSVEETEKLWRRVTSNGAHELHNTQSLHNARKLIMELAQPLVMLQNNIQENILSIKFQEKLLSKVNENKQELLKSVKLEVDDLKAIELDHPVTVCTDPKCIKVIRTESEIQIKYITQCHMHCHLNNVGISAKGDPALRGCQIFKSGETCTKCGCNWRKHMHLKVRYEKVKRSIIDSNKMVEIDCANGEIKKFEDTIKLLRQVITQYEEEFIIIAHICTKFAWLLIKNASTPCNRFIEPYFDMLLEEEKQKIAANPEYSNEKYEAIKKMKENHMRNVTLLEDAIENSQEEALKLSDIFKYRDQLFSLKHTGDQFKQMMENANWTKMKEVRSIPEKVLLITERNLLKDEDPVIESPMWKFFKQFWIFS